MKKITLLIISALICGMLFTSCEKNEQNEQGIKEKLYVVGGNSQTISENLIFTNDDIKSFNVTSGEIVFVKGKADEIISRINQYSELRFFIDNKSVFVPSLSTIHFDGNRFCGSPLPWANLNDLGLLVLNSSACFLVEGYFPWHFISDNVDDREAILKKQEDNAKKREKEMKVLIEYLKKAGKNVE
jgi:hypothetical protein